jgi:hypothetical protein
MSDNIVDDSPEMAFDDPKIAEFIASTTGAPAPEPKADTKDVKTKAAVSSTAPAPKDTEDEPEETLDTLKARVTGLQAELTRRRGNADRVEALEQEVTNLKSKSSAPADEFGWIRKLDDDGLSSKSVDWDDELADARAKYGRAEESGDDRAMERQGHRILVAKKTQAAFRKETLDRTRREQAQAQEAQTEAQSIQSEITDMHDTMTELLPDLLTKGSDAWNAGNDEYVSHPKLMQRLGPLGEVVAAAMAVVRNPALLGKTTPAARRDVIGSLEKAVKKSLSTGVSAQSQPRSVDVNVDTGEGLARFNAMIEKIKGG